MRRIAFFIIVGIVCFTFSCKKEEKLEFAFEGTINNAVTNAPIENCTIEIDQRVQDINFTTDLFLTGASAVSANDGTYSATLERERVTQFRYSIYADNHYSEVQVESSQTVNTGETNVRNFSLDPRGYIRFSIKNVGNVNSEDALTIYCFNFRKDCDDCIKNGFNYFPNTDSTFLISTTAEKYASFFYKDEFEEKVTYDSIFVIKGDTLNYLIEY